MLSKSSIERVISAALETGGDFADIFVEDRINNDLKMVNGTLEKAISGREFGIGIRILKDCFYIYAYTNDFTEKNLINLAREAAKSLIGNNSNISINLIKKEIENKHKIQIMPNNVDKKEKTSWLRRAHEAAKDYDEVIKNTYIDFNDSVQNVLIANSDGLLINDTRARNRIKINVLASKGMDKETGSIGPGFLGGLEYMRNLNIEACACEAARSAKTMLYAKFAPVGRFPVVIDNGFGGVIFHEACGHGLEATSVANNASVFSGKLGEQVASPLVTAYDDGTITNAWGSMNIDDEGKLAKKNLLIENGVLKGYLIDKLEGRRLGIPSTGSGRRESYKFSPTARMTNTYIASGDSTPDEIISNTEFGIYAKNMGGGSVNPATGQYNFIVKEGYIIRNGKIHEPIKGATLIGDGISTLKNIDMVGNNLLVEAGMCGSISGMIPAAVGQPMIRVSELTVGGRKEQ